MRKVQGLEEMLHLEAQRADMVPSFVCVYCEPGNSFKSHIEYSCFWLLRLSCQLLQAESAVRRAERYSKNSSLTRSPAGDSPLLPGSSRRYPGDNRGHGVSLLISNTKEPTTALVTDQHLTANFVTNTNNSSMPAPSIQHQFDAVCLEYGNPGELFIRFVIA